MHEKVNSRETLIPYRVRIVSPFRPFGFPILPLPYAFPTISLLCPYGFPMPSLFCSFMSLLFPSYVRIDSVPCFPSYVRIISP